MTQLCVRFQLLCDHAQAFVSEWVFVESYRAQIRIGSQVGGEQAYVVVMHLHIGEIYRANVIISN